MRTFPKELAEFRRQVEARGAAMRQLSREELVRAGNQPIEHLLVQGRPATIGIIVQNRADGSLLVVVQGFMPCRLFGLLPFGSSVALDGFYKYSDGSTDPMSYEDERRFD